MDSNPWNASAASPFFQVTSIPYEGHTINIVDTPGHAIRSEVSAYEDGRRPLLLVDAVDGPMPRKVCLKKSLHWPFTPFRHQ